MASIDPKHIVIKGIREGLSVLLPGNSPWDHALTALEARLRQAPAFFKGGRVALLVGPRTLTEADMRQARDLLARHDVTLWAIVGEEAETQRIASALGLDVIPQPRPPAPPVESRTWEVAVEGDREPIALALEDWPDAGLVVRRTLRSGQTLRYPGSIAVIGDVNPGAEIIAGGDILVWGKLRGTVHAGALGNEGAIVCALDLAPTQIRIGSHISRSPDERRRKSRPEVARVRDGQITAEPWGL
ncbi:MAG TPA: septum site-determining protein MinC [Anaerolineae bacterium]|nr:septum site-determining protein MinC [Anaerolineae bacterium]